MLNSAYLEINNFCNSSCIYCYNSCRNNEYITVEKFKQLVERLKTVGVHTIILSGGEPTIHPNFIELIKILEENKLNFGMSTNAICINERILQLFRKNNGFIQVSLDTTDNENYKKIRVVDKLNIVLKNIEKIIANEINLDVGIVLTKQSIITLEKTIRDLNKMGVATIHAEEIKDVGFAKKYYNDLYIDDYFEVLKKLYDLEKELYPNTSIGVIEDILYRIVNKECTHSCCNCMEGNMIQIDLKGEMYHCKNQGKQSYIGNIFSDDWNKSIDIAKNFKLIYENTKCSDCEYGYICRGGCRTKIYANSNNLYEKGIRCEEMKKIISLIIEEKEKRKIDKLLLGIELSNSFNKMNGFQKWV